ncbi:topoisomerase C-terminal repeat-containing protein [Clostridium sp.]|uniref:topoisomerase C-terminal repeat-containing protein n=1 Tax=Clostridium sp. TaxID=1506 RepID=UPI00359FE560
MINKKIAEKAITETTVKKFLKDKKTRIIKEFKSKSEENFGAALVFEKGQVKFYFN